MFQRCSLRRQTATAAAISSAVMASMHTAKWSNVMAKLSDMPEEEEEGL
jgi:hypothetical protein